MEYPKSPRVPQALFAQGRIKESQQDYEGALEVYSQMKLDHVESPWTSLAINRIILMRSESKIQD